MLSSFSVKKPYTVVVAIIIVAILGVVSFLNMTTDLMPSMNMPYAIVTTTYVGASPEEVEEVVTKNIEQSMTSISNIENIASTSSENFSMVMIEFSEDVNMDTAMLEMREKLDMLLAFMPEEVQTPMIMKLNPSMMPVMAVAVSNSNSVDDTELLRTKIIPQVESIDGIATVSTMGIIDNLINVEIDNEKIDQINEGIYNAVVDATASQIKPQLPPGVEFASNEEMLQAMLSPEELAEIPTEALVITNEMIEGILKGQNFSMPTGNITDDNVNYLVKTGDKIKTVEELENLLVISTEIDGFEKITLSDITTVNLLNTASDTYSKVNGESGVLLTLSKQAEFSTAEITKSANERFDELTEKYEGIHFSTLMDQGDYVNVMIKAIFSNIILGTLLAAVILLIFLKSFRSTFVISLSILVSVVCAYVLMYFSGITLNIISMGGLALGIGMLVDNSVVVLENIYRMRNNGMPAKQAAIEGAKQVSGAIVASTITTIIVFVPILFTEGFTRQIFTDMGLTITFSLVSSLVVALTLVPTAAATVLSKKPVKVNKTFEKLKISYSKSLKKTLDHKWVVYLLVAILLGASAIASLSLGTELLPETDMGNFMVSIEMPDETSKEDIYANLDETSKIIAEIEGVETVGTIFGGNDPMQSMMGSGGNNATVYVLLDADRDKDISTSSISKIIRNETKDFDYELTVNSTGADMSALTGGAVVVDVFARDLDTLAESANIVAEKIATVEGVIDVENGIAKQSDELKITVDKDEAMKNGIAVAQVFMEVNALLERGNVATSITENGIDYDIYVDKDGSEIDITDIENMLIETPMGETVKVKDIATVTKTKGLQSINRDNSQRKLSVTASIENGYMVGDINADVADIIKDIEVPKDVTIEQVGQQEMLEATFKDLILMLGMAIVFIYLVMVAQFQSLLSPFIVMFTIPLAFTGGLFAQIITGIPISAVSLIGMVLLVGIVVNNGIVFVDYTNKLVKEENMPVREALIEAGKDRIRPILLTALTTIFAQLALCLDTSSAASMTQAMAITSIGGLTYATILTLFLVPSLYESFHKNDKKRKEKRLAKQK